MIEIRKGVNGYVVLGHGTQLPEPIPVVKKRIPVLARCMETEFSVETDKGVMTGKAGDYLMTGVDGEMYPCAAHIFEKSYDCIDPEWVDSEVMEMEEERHL